MTRPRPRLFNAILAAFAGLVLLVPAAHADDDARDQALARKALLEGRIQSLADITAKVKTKLPGTILGVELEVEDDGRFVYEFDVVDSAGRLKEVDVDAATGEILSIEDDD